MPGIVVEPSPYSVCRLYLGARPLIMQVTVLLNHGFDFRLAVVQSHKLLPAILELFQLGLLLEGTMLQIFYLAPTPVTSAIY